MPPRLHAITIHHRGKEMFARCIETLAASRDVALDIVVVANACQEELPEIIETSPKIHLVVSQSSIGFSAANNLGVDWARRHLGEPDAYYFVNNDTESTPGALARLSAALDDPRIAVAGPQLRILDAPEHLNSLGINVTEDAWGWDEGIGLSLAEYGPLPGQRPVLAVTGSAILITTDVYHQIDGWTEIYDYYFEDIDLCLKAWEHGHQVVNVPEAIVYHKISATMTEGSDRKQFFFWRNRLLLAMIHWPLPLLLAVWKRALVTEILGSEWQHNGMLRRAVREALGRSPRLLRQRWRMKSDRSWRRFLHPPGSVPVISLPEMEPAQQEASTGADVSGNDIEEDVGEPPSVPTSPSAVAAGAGRLAARVGELETALATTAAERDHLATELATARADLASIHNSRMWALWMTYLKARRWVLRPFGR